MGQLSLLVCNTCYYLRGKPPLLLSGGSRSLNVPDNINQIVIYCHGFGENKSRIEQHAEVLADYNIGMIGFDFPCHGEDITEYQSVTYDLCIDYLDKVINYLEDTYPNIPISIIGSSFG